MRFLVHCDGSCDDRRGLAFAVVACDASRRIVAAKTGALSGHWRGSATSELLSVIEGLQLARQLAATELVVQVDSARVFDYLGRGKEAKTASGRRLQPLIDLARHEITSMKTAGIEVGFLWEPRSENLADKFARGALRRARKEGWSSARKDECACAGAEAALRAVEASNLRR
jgi:ribonuclease HI